MKNFLIVAHNSRFIVQFELNNIKLLQSMGFTVHCATNFHNEHAIKDAKQILLNAGVALHQIDIERSPFRIVENARAYFQLKQVLQAEDFAGIHCHTPMGGMIGRLAANTCGIRNIIYTAHGFHFYKGCPLKNKLIYQKIERWLSRYTDALITINQEDFSAAKLFPLRGRAYCIHGVGIDLKRITQLSASREETRKRLNIPTDAFVFVSVGELNKNKNHVMAIRAFAKVVTSKTYYFICGVGPLQEKLDVVIKELGLGENVKLLGFRKDVAEILLASDCFVFPSFREGLSVSLMEAMAFGLPCIASRIRGNVDLISNDIGGYLVDNRVDLYANAMKRILYYPDIRYTMAAENRTAIQQFDVNIVRNEMKEIYSHIENR